MTRRVRVTALAKLDIREAAARYEAKREGLGAEFINQVDKSIRRIAKNPLAYRPVIDDVRRASLEKFPYGLWFTVDPDGTIVLACLHHKRSPTLVTKRLLGLEP